MLLLLLLQPRTGDRPEGSTRLATVTSFYHLKNGSLQRAPTSHLLPASPLAMWRDRERLKGSTNFPGFGANNPKAGVKRENSAMSAKTTTTTTTTTKRSRSRRSQKSRNRTASSRGTSTTSSTSHKTKQGSLPSQLIPPMVPSISVSGRKEGRAGKRTINPWHTKNENKNREEREPSVN